MTPTADGVSPLHIAVLADAPAVVAALLVLSRRHASSDDGGALSKVQYPAGAEALWEARRQGSRGVLSIFGESPSLATLISSVAVKRSDQA